MNRTAPRGFVLPAVVILLAIAALLVVDALRGAALTQALASAAHLRLRAFEAAEGGLAATQGTLATGRNPPALLEGSPSTGVSASTTARLELVETVAAGYSANRVHAQRWRVRSEGRAARGTHITLEAGFTRRVAAP
jgi:Tfp pilus assembly protein PilX